MPIHKYLISLYFLLCIGLPAQAADTPAVDARVQKLSEELRCLVCQNQSLADSNADLAVDLKNQVREQIIQGASDRQVIDFMTARYGDFVLYRPPLKATTLLLWFGPGLLLIGGLIALFMRLRRRTEGAAEPVLTDAERARAAALLNINSGEPGSR